MPSAEYVRLTEELAAADAKATQAYLDYVDWRNTATTLRWELAELRRKGGD